MNNLPPYTKADMMRSSILLRITSRNNTIKDVLSDITAGLDTDDLPLAADISIV